MLWRIRILCFLLVVSLGLFANPLSVSARPDSESIDESVGPRLITVTGEAEVRVVPDEVILTLGVETHDLDLATAKRQNDEIVEEVFARVTSYGIDPAHIQTDYVSIEPRYQYGYDPDDFLGYFVQKTIVITLKDMGQFEDLLTGTLEAGVRYVHGIEFRTSELRKHRDAARALAIQAAQEKAEAMAAELGQSIGDPHLIQEDRVGWWSWYNTWWGSRSGGGMTQNVVQESGSGTLLADSTIAPGQISVTARVMVSFELQ